jgi:integrase
MKPETTENKVPAWRPTAVQGLYQYKNGIFYSRYSLNGTRSWRSLETNVFTVAKLKHSEQQGKIEMARQQGLVVSANYRTMGGLAEEYRRRLEASTLEGGAQKNSRFHLERLQANWDGNFETAQVRGVSLTDVIALRNRLAKVRWTVKHTKCEKTGYSPAIINKTLGVLKLLLDIAVENHTIPQNPFDKVGALQEKVFVPVSSRVPQLPTRADMDRVFAEMLVLPIAEDDVPERVAMFRRRAEAAVEHAQFLAYSGMRWQEANAAQMEDDHGDTMLVRGTKTAAAKRTIPVIAPLRQLLDRAKARGVTGRVLSCDSSRAALRRACKRLGLPVLRHHDLRHYFTTVCIESGVDIPTVASWLGHADGGALLMKTYRHLRMEHSIEAAKKVTFASVQATAA